MMKKILAIALAIVMLFAVVACNKNGADDGNDDAVADKVIQNDTYTDAIMVNTICITVPFP